MSLRYRITTGNRLYVFECCRCRFSFGSSATDCGAELVWAAVSGGRAQLSQSRLLSVLVDVVGIRYEMSSRDGHLKG